MLSDLIRQTLETSLADARRRLEAAQRGLDTSQADHADLIRARTELECQLDDVRQLEEDGEVRRGRWEEELREVGERMREVEEEVGEVGPGLEEARREERAVQQRYVRRVIPLSPTRAHAIVLADSTRHRQSSTPSTPSKAAPTVSRTQNHAMRSSRPKSPLSKQHSPMPRRI